MVALPCEYSFGLSAAMDDVNSGVNMKARPTLSRMCATSTNAHGVNSVNMAIPHSTRLTRIEPGRISGRGPTRS